jgi:hypothetical protein
MFGGNPVTPVVTPASVPAPQLIPDNAYTLPDPSSEALNMAYWRGYREGMAARGIIPSPAGIVPDQYGNGWLPYWRSRVTILYRTESLMGSLFTENVGYNNAIQAGAIYCYHHDPRSPYFVVT